MEPEIRPAGVRPPRSALYDPAPRAVVSGVLTLARLLGFFGGLVALVAMTLPLLRVEVGPPRAKPPLVDGGYRLRDYVPPNEVKEVGYWEIPSSPDGVDVGTLAIVCVVAGLLAIVISVSGHVAGLWLPGLTLVTVAFPFGTLGWSLDRGRPGEGPLVLLTGGCLMLLATAGGSRRANAFVLAPLALIASWLIFTGIAVALIGILMGALAVVDAESRRRSALAQGDQHGQSTTERNFLLAACAVSGLGLLLSAANLLVRIVEFT